MATEKEMCLVIEARQKIVYTYNKERCAKGDREGDPHIVFCRKDGSLRVHIWKTGGVQTTPDRLPCWREYHLSDITILREKGRFEPHTTFNPYSKMYVTIRCSI